MMARLRLSSSNSHRVVFGLALAVVSAVAADDNNSNARDQAKPFYLKDIQIGNIALPFTPVTLITMLISLFFIIRSFTGLTSGSTVTASHILLDGDMAKDKLVAMKKEIKQDYNQFMALAKQHSKCPSGKSAGGKLGTFTPGQMVPPFDKAVFDKENKVGSCIGPIQTQFGWHLIWIEDRNFVE